MTGEGLDRVFKFIDGVWPSATYGEETFDAWRLKLDRFSDDMVFAVVYKLAEDHEFMPALSAVYQACVEQGNRLAIAQDGVKALPFGSDPHHPDDARWNAMPDAEKRFWINQSVAQWKRDTPWMEPNPASPLLMAHAAALARRVDMEPPPISYGGKCRACSDALVLIDRETRTYRCDGCNCQIQVGSRAQMIPLDDRQPEPPRRCACGALLMPAFDDGRICRNCEHANRLGADNTQPA